MPGLGAGNVRPDETPIRALARAHQWKRLPQTTRGPGQNGEAARLNTPVWYGSIGVLDHTSKKIALRIVKLVRGRVSNKLVLLAYLLGGNADYSFAVTKRRS
jgi:hypothetical protein